MQSQGETIMQDIYQLRETIKEILDSQKLSVFATLGEGKPYGNLVAFAATADLKTILFATTRATRKYANLLAHADIAMVIDTRTNQTADFSDAVAVTVLGEVREVIADERKKFVSIYLDKHPLPERVRRIPTTALLSVMAKTYIMVSRFQNVQELQSLITTAGLLKFAYEISSF
jgi:nitroimidazol reductase NimA-like FMN-containing flavoprotein (pyridoxamine 5'-phosphate oxidase superfamily)